MASHSQRNRRRSQGRSGRHLPAEKVLARENWLWGLLLVAITIVAYQTVRHAGFIWDDDFHLTKNPAIVGPLGFKSIWRTSAAMYYPLTLTSFWIQHAFWGLNPLPYHLVNVFVHASCAVLLWRVLSHLKVRGAWLGGAIWALHPVQVESVAWVTELKNTQSCFFYLLSILFFLKWRDIHHETNRNSGWWQYGLALVCALLAILSKSSTVMLPVVLALCWWWTDRRWHWRNVVPLIPFLLVSVLASGWTIWEQQVHARAAGGEWAQSWPERLVIAGFDVWFYLGKLVWPHPLIFIYPRWKVVEPQLWAYLPAVVAAGGIFLLWRQRNGRMRPVFFSAAYFIVSLFPVLGFFNVYFFRYSFVGDHLQYLASMGPLALAASGITIALDVFARQRALLKPALCGALLCLLGALTWKQARVYRSLETLWRDTIDKNPASWIAQNNFAMLLQQQGQDDEAIAHFQQAVELAPNIFEIHNNLGDALLVRGRVSESLPHLRKALEMEPNHAFVHYNLGNALLQSGVVDDAIAHLQKALEIDPGYLPAHNALGSALLQRGRVTESLAHLQKALEIDPNDKTAHFNLANTLLAMGHVDEAVSHLQTVLTKNPDDPEAQKNMAWVLATSPEARIRNGAKAVELAERANQLTNGRNLNTVLTLAAAYAEAGRFADAIKAAEMALQVANDSGNMALAEGIHAYIELFRAGYPFHDVRQ